MEGVGLVDKREEVATIASLTELDFPCGVAKLTWSAPSNHIGPHSLSNNGIVFNATYLLSIKFLLIKIFFPSLNKEKIVLLLPDTLYDFL